MDRDLWLNGTRRLDDAYRRYVLRLVSVLMLILGGVTAVAAFLQAQIVSEVHLSSPLGLASVGLVGVAGGIGMGIMSMVRSTTVDRLQTPVIYALVFGAGLLITAGVAFSGPDAAFALAVYLLPLAFAFYLLPKRAAWLATCLSAVGFGVVVFTQPGWPLPWFLWIYISTVIVSSAAVIGSVLARVDEHAAGEQRARAEVDVLNTNLQTLVDDQVEQIARLGQLRRFLSPQVADALSSGEADAMLSPHRREIAVFFSDLRSFTRFTVGEAPEDVLTSLDEYYAAVCAILQRHGATIGSFSGDGIMAFLGDPLPHDDPAGGAVRIALQLHDEMEPLLARWEARGFSLGYGVGIAMGYATLGLLGNEERSDYTAIGPVVNLASRLCSEAANGQILVDHRTYSAIKTWADTQAFDPVTLKGFPEAVPTYSVVGTASG